MMRIFFIVVLVAASCAAGYAAKAFIFTPTVYEFSMPFPDSVKSESLNLGCTAVSHGSAYESRFERSANARAGEGTEKLALNITANKKTASVLYAYDVGIGAADPIQLVVLSSTTSYIVAAGEQLLGVTSLILDVKTYKAVVTYTGQGMLGIKGSSLLLQCR